MQFFGIRLVGLRPTPRRGCVRPRTPVFYRLFFRSCLPVNFKLPDTTYKGLFMKIDTINLTVASAPHNYPKEELPQIAFAGRSNVGKSSLINMLLGKKIAKTSSTPGKTRTINFYNINNTLYLVDLPGYGYAKAPKSEVVSWGKMIEKYLTVVELKGVVFLLDIRRKPSENDIIMHKWLIHTGCKILPVATKTDKVKRSRLKSHMDIIKNTLGLVSVIPFSTLYKTGREEVWESVLSLTI